MQKIYEESRALIERETEHEIEVFGGFGLRGEMVEEIEVEEEPEIKSKKDVKPQSSLFDF